MVFLSRPYARVGTGSKLSLAVMAVAFSALSTAAFAGESAVQMVGVIDDTPALMMHGSQGYLGVTIHDIDADRATALKLKDIRGAEITMIDHDAPACKADLRVHDVIVQMNGQAIEGVEQLRRMLRETPVGRTVNLTISRDGSIQAVSVQLGDRAKLEHQMMIPSDVQDSMDLAHRDGAMPFLLGADEGGMGGFFGLEPRNPLYLGIIAYPLRPQLADYFGLKNTAGLLVETVDEGSPAALAGMKAGDVILRVNGRAIASLDEWLSAIHANRNKQMQITVFRNHKEQTVTLVAGAAKTRG